MSEDWFHRRTHDWGQWSLEDLRHAKQRTGSQVSLVLPARDEAGTIGGIVGRLTSLRDAGLVDELVVIDSDSSDDTAAVAATAGAVVHRAADVRPDLGPRAGKGEALWKSLFVTTGDVLVFMDADLVEWDTHFVTGLLGPLLTAPDVQLVKGFYERPLVHADAEAAYEGGRVTELVARPLLSLRWPALAGIAQPLAGEWAVRRSLFERLSVPTGYAVDLAAVIDTYLLHGVDALAQVDLGRRVHQHQPLRDLGAMALQIMAMADQRTGGVLGPATSVPLRQFGPPTTQGQRGVAPRTREVAVDQRPPALGVPGYTHQVRRTGTADGSA
ncbi:MAG TPA: glucosyl-3-phosphoglycerate synthase [Nocardioidaceae bacterium]|nr:glucosyl-3-phosphoglycerate synthase [Nocardioidaceae bacterium]